MAALSKNELIVIQTKDGAIFTEENQILYFLAEGNYTTMFLEDNKELIIAKPLTSA